MTVKELIAELSNLNPDAVVCAYDCLDKEYFEAIIYEDELPKDGAYVVIQPNYHKFHHE